MHFITQQRTTIAGVNQN